MSAILSSLFTLFLFRLSFVLPSPTHTNAAEAAWNGYASILVPDLPYFFFIFVYNLHTFEIT